MKHGSVISHLSGHEPIMGAHPGRAAPCVRKRAFYWPGAGLPGSLGLLHRPRHKHVVVAPGRLYVMVSGGRIMPGHPKG